MPCPFIEKILPLFIQTLIPETLNKLWCYQEVSRLYRQIPSLYKEEILDLSSYLVAKLQLLAKFSNT